MSSSSVALGSATPMVTMAAVKGGETGADGKMLRWVSRLLEAVVVLKDAVYVGARLFLVVEAVRSFCFFHLGRTKRRLRGDFLILGR